MLKLLVGEQEVELEMKSVTRPQMKLKMWRGYALVVIGLLQGQAMVRGCKIRADVETRCGPQPKFNGCKQACEQDQRMLSMNSLMATLAFRAAADVVPVAGGAISLGEL